MCSHTNTNTNTNTNWFWNKKSLMSSHTGLTMENPYLQGSKPRTEPILPLLDMLLFLFRWALGMVLMWYCNVLPWASNCSISEKTTDIFIGLKALLLKAPVLHNKRASYSPAGAVTGSHNHGGVGGGLHHGPQSSDFLFGAPRFQERYRSNSMDSILVEQERHARQPVFVQVWHFCFSRSWIRFLLWYLPGQTGRPACSPWYAAWWSWTPSEEADLWPAGQASLLECRQEHGGTWASPPLPIPCKCFSAPPQQPQLDKPPQHPPPPPIHIAHQETSTFAQVSIDQEVSWISYFEFWSILCILV